MPRRRGWGSSGEDDDDDGGDFNPSRQPTKRRKTHVDDDGSGHRPSMESQITETFGGGDHGGDYGAGGDGVDSVDVDGNADVATPAARRGRPPGRRNNLGTEESMELAPYMLSERRSTRAVVAAIQEALEPRISAASRECALYNAKIVAERSRVGPVYWDSNTQTLQAIYGIRAPKWQPEEQIVPAGAEVSAATRSAAAGKRQNPEQLYRELMEEIADAKGEASFNRYAEWKDKFASGWAEPVDVAGAYVAPVEATVQASMPRFTSTRAAAAAALASFQAPGGILSSLTPAPNKIAARTIQTISRIAHGGGRGRKKRGGDSDEEDDDDISDDEEDIEEIDDDDGAGASGDSGDAGDAPAPATPAPRKAAAPRTPKSTSKAAATIDPAILCADCHEATAEETLSCSQCRSLHHPSCLQLQVRTIARAQSYPWRCNDCKLCETCNATGDEEKLLMCDACDRGYHTYCMNPPLESLPEGEWICDICKADGILPSTEPQPIAEPQPFVPKKRGRPPKNAGTPKASSTTSSTGRKRKRTNMDDFDDLDDQDDLDEPADDDDGEYR